MSRLEFLRPSSAATWVVCTGYAAMRAAYPAAPEEADDDIREDGTAAHWLSHQITQGIYPELGSLSPNQRTLTEEMFDGVDMYHDALREHIPAHVPIYHEHKLLLDSIHRGMSGTPDAFAWDGEKRRIYIADFKFGFRFVEVWYNWQMICYTLGVIDWLRNQGIDANDQTISVCFIICQPRSYHRDGPVRIWRAAASDLRGHWNQLIYAADVAMSDKTECTPNPGCGDCGGRHACKALQAAAYSALEVSYSGVPLELSPVAAGDELRRLKEAAKRIEARVTGLEMQVEQAIRNGEVVPHWSLSPTYARETWREGVESHVLGLGSYYNVNVAKPVKPISPAQARKLLPLPIVAALTHKPSTGVRLTPADPYEARKKFSS